MTPSPLHDNEVPKEPACAEKIIIVTPQDLPLSCPTDDMVLWNAHPKVYLPIAKTGQYVCPYCSCRFILKQEF
jgi:uncharacterized Zn-finger protein